MASGTRRAPPTKKLDSVNKHRSLTWTVGIFSSILYRVPSQYSVQLLFQAAHLGVVLYLSPAYLEVLWLPLPNSSTHCKEYFLQPGFSPASKPIYLFY